MSFLYKLLVSSFTLSVFSEGIILPIYAIFVQQVGGGILEASGTMATFLITEGIFTMLVHRLHWSRTHRILLLILGWAIWTVGVGLYLIVSNILMLFLTQILTALGNALANPIFEQELAAHTDNNTAQFAWGFFEGANSIAQGIAAVVGGVIAIKFGFSALIWVMAITATGSFLLILLYIWRRHLKNFDISPDSSV